ncbi:hypothetical protein [Teichococcus aestuarii]|uniref:hypothetical protein n=1 Tax=Teichococcus aestuarii TaxID=568898 RepID=UPI0036218BD5
MSAIAPPFNPAAVLPAGWAPASLAPGSRGRRPHPWSPAWCQGRSPLFWLGANGAVLLGYLVLGWAVGRFFAAYGLFPSPIWLPAGRPRRRPCWEDGDSRPVSSLAPWW